MDISNVTPHRARRDSEFEMVLGQWGARARAGGVESDDNGEE